MAYHSYKIFQTQSSTDANAPQVEGVVNPTGTVYSSAVTGRHADGYGLTIITTGTLTGTFTLWMTDKPNPNLANDNDWVQDATFAPTNPAGSAVSFRDDASNAKSMYKRIKYVHSSGTGTIFGYVNVPRTA